MKTKTYLIAGLLTLAGAVAARADSLVDTWTATGGAWTTANQTGFSASGGGGTLLSDQTLANDGSGSSATLNVTNFSISQGGNLYTSYLYTGGSAPTFTLTSDTVLSDVATITVTITAGGLSTFDASALALTFDDSSITLGSFSSVDTSTQQAGSEMYTYTYTWDVTATGSDAFTVGWTDNSLHTAFTDVTLTQSGASAIPEPATYGAIVGGLALVGVMLRRRLAAKKGV